VWRVDPLPAAAPGRLVVQAFEQLLQLATSSRARYSVSALVRSARARSSSSDTRSRSSCRFWASRIRGAAYAAWVEKARLSRMNG
jgi:hypothetical protein